jgi:LCP family protein required for cell wall assembly
MGKSKFKTKDIDELEFENLPELKKPSFFWKLGRRVLVLTFFSGLLGAGLAWFLMSSPLTPKSSTALPGRRDRITGIIPATLARPINVLVLGIDKTGHLHKTRFSASEGLGGNSDTMLLARIDPSTHQVTVLSIPRDTQVQIAGRLAKINDANAKGGIALAGQTVSQLLGSTPIDRYLRVDSRGFIELVDALGGVEVTIPKAMNYEDHTQKLSIHFQPGTQVLNGQHLEEYVRFRHDQLGDIGRVQRQQAVLKSLSSQVLQPWTLLKAPQLLAVIQKNVDTDLSLEELLAVGQALARTDRQKFNFLLLPGRFSQPSEYRLSYWISNPSAIAPLVNRYFKLRQSISNSDAQIDPQTLAIAVANGTQQPGLATKTVALLKAQGFRNAFILRRTSQALQSQSDQTQIIAQKGNPHAALQVQSALGIGQTQVTATGDLTSDVTVIVKSDLGSKLLNP